MFSDCQAMSNVPPNPFNNTAGGPQMIFNAGPPIFNHNQQFGQVPSSQLPPGYAGGLKQDANSNSPLQAPTSVPQNNALQNVTNYNQSGNSSPAFNQPGILPASHTSLQSSPMRPQTSVANKSPLPPNIPQSSGSPHTATSSNSSPTPYGSNFQPQRQINDNAPPLVPSSQFSQPLINGPPISSPAGPAIPSNQFSSSSSGYSVPSMASKPPNPVSVYNAPPMSQAFGPPPVAKPPGPNPMANQPNVPFSAPMGQGGPQRNSPLVQGPPINGPVSGPIGSQPLGSLHSTAINGPSMAGPPISVAQSGPPKVPGPGLASGPGLPSGVPPVVQRGPLGPQIAGSQLPIGPSLQFPGAPRNGPLFPPYSTPGPSMGPPSGPQSLPAQFPPTQHPMGHQMGPPSGPSNPPGPPMGNQMGPPSGPPPGAMKSNMQNRYPQMPPSNFNNQPPSMPPMGPQYPQQPQYNTQAMTQQMGQMSVTKQGFDQLWGHQMVDLLQCRHILPEYCEDPPEIKLGNQFADASNCSPE